MGMPKNLSATQVGAWLRCPRCWLERYRENHEEPPTGNLLFGRAFSEALECLHKGQDYQTAWVQAYSKLERLATERFSTHLAASSETGLSLLNQYVSHGVFNGTPERRFEVKIKQLPVPVIGYFDLEEKDKKGNPIGVVEFKTTSATWTQERVDTELQGTIYYCAFWTMYRVLPHITYVVGDIRNGELKFFETTRSKAQCLELLETINTAWTQMKIAHGPGGTFPGFCDRHKIRVPRTAKQNAIVLPTVDWDN